MKKLIYYLLGFLGDTDVMLLFLPMFFGMTLLMVSSFADLISDKIIRKYFLFGVFEIMWSLFGVQGLIYFRKKTIPFIFAINGKPAIVLGIFFAVVSFWAVFLGFKAVLLK